VIAKFPGTCSVCNGHIKIGSDIDYDSTTKTAKHPDCEPKPGPDAYRLAGELGFLSHADAVRCEWSKVFLLPHGVGSDSAGRVEPSARTGQDTLFDVHSSKERT
jgi:hypothetical protein